MMLLALETSAAVASVALLSDGSVLDELVCDAGRKHAETVQPAVDALLRRAGVSLGAVDAFAVDVGPGSFTGVRIGVCMANAFALSCDRMVIPVDALAALYEPHRGEPGLFCTLVDARNGNAYAAQFRDGRCVEPPRAVEVAPYCAGLPEARFVGDVPDLCDPVAWPAAASVGLAAFARTAQAAAQVAPLYLRPSQAERMAGEKRP